MPEKNDFNARRWPGAPGRCVREGASGGVGTHRWQVEVVSRAHFGAVVRRVEVLRAAQVDRQGRFAVTQARWVVDARAVGLPGPAICTLR